MDTLIFLVSASVVVTLGYGVVWTVRAIRRVGLRRFGRSVGILCWNSLKAILQLFKPERVNADKPAMGSRISMDHDIIGDTQNADLAQTPGFHVNYRTGEFDDGLDPGGIYIDKSYDETHY